MLRWRSESLATLCTILTVGGSLLPATAQLELPNRGAQRYVEYCAGCHGADARAGDKAPSLVSPSAIAASDADLIRVVRDGTTLGMPPFAQIGDANIVEVVRYLRILQGESPVDGKLPEVPGDPRLGRDLFFGKAACSSCHMMQGHGGFIAAGLTNYGRNRSPETILRTITNPDDPLVHSSRVVTVMTRNRKWITGVLRNEDAFTLDLQTQDGRFHMLSRADLSEIRYTDHSLMPSDYAGRLTTAELNDIVSFLILSARENSKVSGYGIER